MGRLFGRLPSELMCVIDPTVAMAIDAAATMAITHNDRKHETIIESRRLEGIAALTFGGMIGAKPEVKWDTVEEW